MPKLHDEFVYGHKFVVKKWEDLLERFDDEKETDANGNEVIEVKSSFDGNPVYFSKVDIESELKKTKKVMAETPIPGAVNNGFKEKFAHQLFSEMAAFAGYAFNKSHSTGYADQTYQTAWLKKHYPIEFMTALLTVQGDDKDKTLDNLKEAKRMGIRIYPPDINRSDKGFYPEKDGIRFGLLSINGVGGKAVDAIIEERNANGKFTSFDDFEQRTKSPVNRSVYRTLIEAGCFDSFNDNRYALLNQYNFDIRGDKKWTGSLQELIEDKDAKKTYSYPCNEQAFNVMRALELEYQLIGIYVSGSPYEDLPFTSLQDMDLCRSRYDKKEYDVGGRIIKVMHFKSGKGCRVTIETQLEPITGVFFGKEYEDAKAHLFVDNIVTLRGYKNLNSYQGKDEEQFICSKILVRDAKKLKKQMGITAKAPAKPKKEEPEELPIMAQGDPKKDPMADLFDDEKEKPKKKRKRKKKLSDEELMMF